MQLTKADSRAGLDGACGPVGKAVDKVKWEGFEAMVSPKGYARQERGMEAGRGALETGGQGVSLQACPCLRTFPISVARTSPHWSLRKRVPSRGNSQAEAARPEHASMGREEPRARLLGEEGARGRAARIRWESW